MKDTECQHEIRNAITIIGCCCRKIETIPEDDDIVRLIDICIEQLNRIKAVCQHGERLP